MRWQGWLVMVVGACASSGSPGEVDSGAGGAPDGAILGVDSAPGDAVDTDGDGISDADEEVLGTDPNTPDEPCAGASAQADVVERPADIILVIDNSPSMGDEIMAVEDNINDNFAAIMAASSVDYKIVVLSRHGDSTREDVCIRAPLSGTDCTPIPPAPANTSTFYHHDVGISSSNSLVEIIETFPTWSPQLRDDAVRVFIEISDDDPSRSADEFEADLFALGGFGDASDRRYIFHSIVGLRAKSPPDTPYQPGEPIQTEKCEPGAVDEAPQYQELSRRTGGLRFPVCHHASYDAVFQEVAEGVVDVTSLPCVFDPPVPPDGDTVDLDRVVVVYTPGGAPAVSLDRVPDAAGCGPGGFYVDAERIVLCPQTCDAVSIDSAGEVDVHVACEPAQVD